MLTAFLSELTPVSARSYSIGIGHIFDANEPSAFWYSGAIATSEYKKVRRRREKRRCARLRRERRPIAATPNARTRSAKKNGPPATAVDSPRRNYGPRAPRRSARSARRKSGLSGGPRAGVSASST